MKPSNQNNLKMEKNRSKEIERVVDIINTTAITDSISEEYFMELISPILEQECIGFHLFVEKDYHPFMSSGRYMKHYKFEEGTPWPDLETVQTWSLPELYQLYKSSQSKIPSNTIQNNGE